MMLILSWYRRHIKQYLDIYNVPGKNSGVKIALLHTAMVLVQFV
jgi:hypothetical protein